MLCDFHTARLRRGDVWMKDGSKIEKGTKLANEGPKAYACQFIDVEGKNKTYNLTEEHAELLEGITGGTLRPAEKNDSKSVAERVLAIGR